MQPKRLITPVLSLIMAIGLIGISSAPIMGSGNIVSAAGCYSLMSLDRLFGIQIDRGLRHNGLLYNSRGQVAGAVISPTKEQRLTLRSQGWYLTGEGRVRSAWAPASCGELNRAGWTKSVTRSRTCMSVAQLDSRFGIDEDAKGTKNGLIRNRGKVIGAVVHLTTSQKESLLRKDWFYQGDRVDLKSIFAPSWCIPIPLGGWTPTPKPVAVCYTIAELDAKYGVVTDAPGTNQGRLEDDGMLAGAVIHARSSERSELESQGWTIQDGDTSDDVASAWSPERCRPLHES